MALAFADRYPDPRTDPAGYGAGYDEPLPGAERGRGYGGAGCPAVAEFAPAGIGALCWPPSIERWARTVAGLLRPGGRLFIREGHPMLWSLAGPRRNGVLSVDFPYFEMVEPQVWTDGGTYVETDVEFTQNVSMEWNHGLGETVTALLNAGLDLTALAEHDSVPWEAMPGQMTKDSAGEWRLTDRPERLAASYTLQARRRD